MAIVDAETTANTSNANKRLFNNLVHFAISIFYIFLLFLWSIILIFGNYEVVSAR